MTLKRLGDGSFLDTETGVLSGYDPQREAAGRRITAQLGQLPQQKAQARQPVMNKSAANNPGVVVQDPATGGVKKIIRPDANLLVVSPYEMGMGSMIPAMSETTKKVVLTGAIVCAALGAVWLNNKFKHKPKTAHKHSK